MSGHSEEQLVRVAMTAMYGVINGQQTVTLSVRGQKPQGFPRGELLSVGTDGSRNYAVHPVKVLAWLHGITSAAQTSAGAGG